MRAKLKPSGQRADRVESAQHFLIIHSRPTFGDRQADIEGPSDTGVPGPGRGQYSSEHRRLDLIGVRIRRFYNVHQYSSQKRGGHFPAWEAPDAYAHDVRLFARSLNGS